MNKLSHSFFYLAILLITLSTPAHAWWFDEFQCCCGESYGISATARVAYYHPESSRMRKVYANGFADYQLEIGKMIGCHWQVWTGVSGFSKEGHSTYSHNSTRLQLIPIYLGVKYFYNVSPCIDLYAGGAACYSMLRIKDHSHYVHEHTNKNAFGGLAQLGLNYYFTDCIFVNLFADYYFQHFHFKKSDSYSYYVERNSLNMSGYKLGGGIGFVF